MPTTTTLVAFAVATIVLSLVPGPSVLFIVGRSIAHGRRVGLASVIGADAGALVLVVLVALGVGALISASEVAYWVIKIAGAAYLIYLGVQTIRHRKQATAQDKDGPPHSLGSTLSQSFLVGVTNPKTLAILTAFFPQFVTPAAGAPAVQMLILGAVYWIIVMLIDAVWALIAGLAGDWFARSPRRRERLATSGGVMMIVLGGVLAVERRAS